MFCHDKFLLQYDTFIVSLIDGMKSSHFDLYHLYSNTILLNYTNWDLQNRLKQNICLTYEWLDVSILIKKVLPIDG